MRGVRATDEPVDEVRICLEQVPRGKGRPRFRNFNTGDGRTFVTAYTDAKTRRYENALKAAAIHAMEGRAPIEGAVTVSIFAGLPVPKSWSRKRRDAALAGVVLPIVHPDFDNLMKSVDSMNKVVWKDDKQVVNATITKRYVEKPYLLVVVRPMESTSCLLFQASHSVPAAAVSSH